MSITRDDRVLGYTRALSLFIVPFLLVAFVLLYGFPGNTKRLFAWTISPTMTPMTLAAAYLGGSYFFLRVLAEKCWHAVKTGFLSVASRPFCTGTGSIISTSHSGCGQVCTSPPRSW
jgi:hypothetical protein